jgi:polyribonucleotide nucleotidyltransferase
MFKIVKKSFEIGGKTLSLESGELARLADGSVLVTFGGSMVLCNVVYDKKKGVANDFFPLMVLYQEKYYACGRIPGGFLKREGKPSEMEVLTSRLIDRSIRPLFDDGFTNDVQVICTVLSYDKDYPTDFAALIGASAALKISGVPILHTLAGVKIGYSNNEYLVNPSQDSKLDLFVAGTKDSILMVESQAKELSDEIIVGAIEFAQVKIAELCAFVESFVEENGVKPKFTFESQDNSALKLAIEADFITHIEEAVRITTKTERYAKLDEVKALVVAKFVNVESPIYTEKLVLEVFKSIQKELVRKRITNDGIRIDGRALDEIRPISIRTSVLPSAHGSALFTRGETQALVALTLGGEKEEQMIEGLDGLRKERFMLHYNFPAFSVNEIGRYSGAGRREIGHGKLAFKAIEGSLPSKDFYPQAIRIVSEILESNGSSSMATVCGASLALMDAGVPFKKHVAGIAMGLIKDGDKIAVLSDILGDEDFLGDMDFKVAGTKDGITALQMDIKITGVDVSVLKTAIEQAKKGRAHIESKMEAVISKPSEAERASAPKFFSMLIDPQRVREVIGQGGSVIKAISEFSGASIDVSRDGNIKITSDTNASVAKARQAIEEVLFKLEEGKIYDVIVTKVVDSYAIVSTESGKTGMLHISDVSHSNIENISFALCEGERLKAKLLDSGDSGRIKFSIKNINQETGEEFNPESINF